MDRHGVAGVVALLGLGLAGYACKTVAPEAVVVIRAGDPCLFVPPPTPKKVSYSKCDGGYVACLDSASADVLGDNLEAMQRWEREAWIRCGPGQDAGK